MKPSEPRRILCKNNRNWEMVQKTLDMLPGGRGQVLVDADGEPELSPDGLVVIIGNGFTEFALKNQGYADVVRSED